MDNNLTLEATTKLLWDPVWLPTTTLQEHFGVVDYIGSYEGFLSVLKTKTLNQPTGGLVMFARGVIIQDLIEKTALIESNTPLLIYGLTLDPKTLLTRKKDESLESLAVAWNSSHLITYRCAYADNPRNYYKKVLKTYNKVTFFDHFNSFKYIITKELKAEFEHIIYQYFSGFMPLDIFREKFLHLESQLKPQQLIKFQPVKSFIVSEKAEALLQTIRETDQEKLKHNLDTHSLDYFDVNYLKAYLRDFGKTKEEKAKPKERVQELKLEQLDY